MYTIKRTDNHNIDFIKLVRLLDEELAIRDGDEHPFYDQFNNLDNIKYAVVAFEDGVAVGCGAIKEFVPDTVEIKRMYTIPASRGKGLATLILKELEEWASELSYKRCILETGKKQPEAIRLYEKNEYHRIPNYGQYANVENSLCYGKDL